MSICDELLTVLTDKMPKQELNRHICEEYEPANRLFEGLLQQKLIVKRGYQLLPIENRICQDTEINYSTKPWLKDMASILLRYSTSSQTMYHSRRRFLFSSKRHLSFTSSLLYSKTKPLHWVSFLNAALWAAFLGNGKISILTVPSTKKDTTRVKPHRYTMWTYGA